MATYAIDFETSYSKDRDIKSLGVVPYLEHADTDIYLVSIKGPGVSYSGPLAGAPWRLIDGKHWVSHNAAFDGGCFIVARMRGQIPNDVFPSEWDCTANLCAFLAAPRSLDKALHQLLGIVISKATRDAMKGKQWAEMSPAFQAEVAAYALTDAEMCLRLWETFGDRWPEQERKHSRHTMGMCLNGIATHKGRIDEGIATLTSALWATEQKIPWASELDAKGKEISITSPKALKAECVKRGIPPPMTTADKSELFIDWLNKYEEQADFVKAVKEYRSINRTIEIFKKLRDQTRSDGRIRYSMKYFGAHTGRSSGEAGLNFANLTKGNLHFDAGFNRLNPLKYSKARLKELTAHIVDLRGCFVPGPGKKFIVADLSQIEARVALWFADDRAQLDLIRSGLDLYEAHARSKMGYKMAQALKDYCDSAECPEKDKNIRQFAKCRVLGLGFGMGFKKFVVTVALWAGIKITEAEAKAIVNDFRASNPGIVKLWNTLDRAMRAHAAKRDSEPFYVELPSWRKLAYFDVNGSEDLRARDELGGMLNYYYGGILFQNLVQATARDILVAAIDRIEEAGHSVVLHVYDEVVCEVDLHVPASEIAALMTMTPHWCEGLPIGCSAKESDRYFK